MTIHAREGIDVMTRAGFVSNLGRGRAGQLLLLSAVLAAGCMLTAGVQASAPLSTRPQRSNLNADALGWLDRAKNSLGGIERLNRVSTLLIEGTREVEGTRGVEGVANRLTFTLHWPIALRWRPQSCAVDLEGLRAWQTSIHSANAFATAGSDRTALSEIALLFLCRLPADIAAPVRVIAPPVEFGLMGHGLEVVMPDEQRLFLVLDPATDRPRGIVRRGRVSEGEDSLWRALRIEAHVTDAGITFPQRLTERSAEAIGTIDLTQVRAAPSSQH